MDYEQKYKKALETARKINNGEGVAAPSDWTVYEVIFPELKESKDDKIRNAIIAHIEGLKHYDSYYGISPKEMVAWLEKQGEPLNESVYDTEDKEIYQAISIGLTDVFNECGWSDFGGIPIENIQKWLEKQGELKETLCDKCKKTQPSHSCQDITALGRCAIEKRGEQKPAVDFRAEDWCVSKVDGKIHNIYNSEVGPKFKVGDWVVDNCNNLWKIVGIMNGFYILEDGDEGGSRPTIEWVDKTFHLWTIQDAKDGDVLLFEGYYNSIVLFQGIGINGKGRINYHCKCDLGNYSFGIQGDVACLGTIEKDAEHYHPATKEQRDILFSKMHEAGYEWDADKKKLKKIEDEEYNGEDYGIDSLYHAQRILEKTLGKVDGYQTDDGILSHKCAITAVKKLYGQKPSWSEEDDYNLQCMIAKVDNDIQNGNVGRNQELIDWLKSIKLRMEEQ